MRRVVSVFLPSWPTDRLRRLPGSVMPPQDRPLITEMHNGRRQAVAAVDHAATSMGLFPGMPLAQAQAMVPGLTVAPAEPKAEARALGDLAAWCLRYAPLTAPDQPDGIWVDATGSAHLFGGESELLGDIIERLARGGLTGRAAIADTPGAAWAVARHAPTSATAVPPGETAPSLRSLPIAALRLSHDIATGLARVGFERIHQLMAAPRAPFDALPQGKRYQTGIVASPKMLPRRIRGQDVLLVGGGLHEAKDDACYAHGTRQCDPGSLYGRATAYWRGQRPTAIRRFGPLTSGG
jgi:protein ImuB